MSTPTASRVDAEPTPPLQLDWQPLPIHFSGSGSEYFRIWVVNLLLVIATLSLYLPFAKARRLRYFHGNTVVGGHALGFHGQGRTMLRGYLLVLAFAVLYAAAGYFSALAAGLAGLALVLLWPALWQASLRFRLANTSWRGLRMRFDGSVADAYRSMLPALLPGGLVMLLSGLRGTGERKGSSDALVGAWADAVVGLCVLVLVGLVPVLLARLKRYQHGHYHFAGETTTLAASTASFYRLWWRGGLLMLLPVMLLLAGGGLLWLGSDPEAGPSALATAGLVGLVLGFYALLFVLVQPWYVARLQNLVWSHTAAPRLRFASRLRVRDLAWLTLKNLLLTMLTLGFYRPFALVATTRLRLQALQVHTLGPAESWLAGAPGRLGDASGDAAGDLLGVDLGL